MEQPKNLGLKVVYPGYSLEKVGALNNQTVPSESLKSSQDFPQGSPQLHPLQFFNICGKKASKGLLKNPTRGPLDNDTVLIYFITESTISKHLGLVTP